MKRDTWADDVAQSVMGPHRQVATAYQELAALFGGNHLLRGASGFQPNASGFATVATRSGPVFVRLAPSSGGRHRVTVVCPFCGKHVGLGARAVLHARSCPSCRHEDCAEDPELAMACKAARKSRR